MPGGNVLILFVFLTTARTLLRCGLLGTCRLSLLLDSLFCLRECRKLSQILEHRVVLYTLVLLIDALRDLEKSLNYRIEMCKRVSWTPLSLRCMEVFIALWVSTLVWLNKIRLLS